MSWAVYETDNDEKHVVPEQDLRLHFCDRHCWCFPEPDDEEPSVFVHVSLDRREEYEEGRKLH